MTTERKKSLIQLNVTNGLSVAVAQHAAHEFIMPTKDVAIGYGVSTSTIRQHFHRHSDEFTHGVHYVKGVTITHTLSNIQPHSIYFTKAGVVRLGFFIKSERAKLFRDWAEKVVLNALEKSFKPNLKAKPKAKRIDEALLIDLLADVAHIRDHAVRISLVNKLTLA